MWFRHRPTNRQLLKEISRKVGHVMATQEQLNALVARIDGSVAGIRLDIEQIKAAHPEIDLSALEERVAGLEGLDAENPEAVPEPGPDNQ